AAAARASAKKPLRETATTRWHIRTAAAAMVDTTSGALISEPATCTTVVGPVQGRKPRELGSPIRRRYGDFACAQRAAQVLMMGIGRPSSAPNFSARHPTR